MVTRNILVSKALVKVLPKSVPDIRVHTLVGCACLWQASPFQRGLHMRPLEDEGRGGASAIWTQSPFPLRGERSGMKRSVLTILIVLNKVGKKRLWIFGSCPCVPNNITVYRYIYIKIFCLQISGDRAHLICVLPLKGALTLTLRGRFR